MKETNLSLMAEQNQQIIRQLVQQCAAKPDECYQCGKCSAGCPLAASMDMPPRQMMRYLQLGLAEDMLHSRAPWICASCHICSARCPHGLPVAELMEALRQLAESQNIRPLRRPYLFTVSFLRPVRWFGRSHELTLTALYNISSGRLLQHFSYLPGLLKGRKLKFIPMRVKDRAAIRRLMDNCAKEAKRR